MLKDKFLELLDKVYELSLNYERSQDEIQKLLLKKTDLIKINMNQEKDDLNFYNSIFDDAIYYVRKSLKVRELKFKKDFCKNYRYLEENFSDSLVIHKIDKNYFLNKFQTYMDNNNQKYYRWQKSDKKKLLFEWMLSFEEVIDYHVYIYSSLKNILDLNKRFFTDRPDKNENIYTHLRNLNNDELNDSNSKNFKN